MFPLYSLVLFCFSFILTVADSESVAFRNGDKVTLPCIQLNGSCESVDWLFAGSSNKSILLFREEKTPQQLGEEFGQLYLTSDCSLEIMSITEEHVGQFACRLGLNQDLATFHLSVVTCEYLYVIQSV